MKVFTFWEGYLPKYIDLCMYSWEFFFTVLNFANLHKYTDITPGQLDLLRNFTLPQVADFVRVHVLRDNGGVWLDADTIMTGDKLPKETMIGDPEARTVSIGYLRTEAQSDMFVEWAKFQDDVILNTDNAKFWNCFGNAFTDLYVANHKEITIAQIGRSFPETYMIEGNASRYRKYEQFYFERRYKLKDIKPTNMIMLHNSWTPEAYKKLTVKEILDDDRTLSNILRERFNDQD